LAAEDVVQATQSTHPEWHVSGGGEAVMGQTATIKGIPRGCTIEVKWSTALDAGSDYDSDATDPPSVDDLQRSLRQALADSFNMVRHNPTSSGSFVMVAPY